MLRGAKSVELIRAIDQYAWLARLGRLEIDATAQLDR